MLAQPVAVTLDPQDAEDPSVQAAVAYWSALATVLRYCDGAIAEDGQGFSGPDAGPARRLVYADPLDWTPQEIEKAYAILGNYRHTQLPLYGIDYAALPRYVRRKDEDERAAERRLRAERKQRTITADHTGLLVLVRFPKRLEIVEAMRKLPGYRKFRYGDGGGLPYWEAATTEGNGPRLLALAADHGFTVDDAAQALLLASVTPGGKADRRVEREGAGLAIYFPYEYELKEAVKALGYRFKDTPKRWLGPVSAAVAGPLLALAERYEVDVPQDVRDELQEVEATAAVRLVASRSASATVPELAGYRSRRGFTPYPFQEAGVAGILDWQRGIIADVMGLGKTVQALLGLRVSGAYPALVLCPASVKLNWAREAGEWLEEGRRVQVLNGNKDELDPTADVYVANYDIAKSYVEAFNERGIGYLVLDEAHYCKSATAQRTLAATAIAYRASYEDVYRAAKSKPSQLWRYDTADGIPYRVLLSGTPLLSRPVELVQQLRIAGRFRELFGGWSSYAQTYCNAFRNRFGWDVSGANEEALPELNRIMRQCCYTRRDEREAQLELPELVTSGVLLPIDNRSEYRRAATDIVQYVKRVAREQAALAARLQGLDAGSAEAEALRAEQKAGRAAAAAEQLVLMSKLRSLVAIGKIPAAIGWVGDWLAGTEGRKLVLFCHHREAQQRLLAALQERGQKEGYTVARIFGADSSQERQRNIDAFQQDPEVRVIVCSLMAAREGITLTAAHTVAFLELDWVPGTHLQAERRVLRIGQGFTCWAYYLLAEDTTDEPLSEVLDHKRAVITAAADGRVIEDKSGTSLARMLDYLAQQTGTEIPEAILGIVPDPLDAGESEETAW